MRTSSCNRGIYWPCFFLAMGIIWVLILVSCDGQNFSDRKDVMQNSKPEVNRSSDVVLLANKFWEAYDFEAIDVEMNGEELRGNIVDYIILLDDLSLEEVTPAINRMLDQAKNNPVAFQFFIETLYDKLYNPNSILRNDFYYSKVLNYLISSDKVGEIDKVKYKTNLTLVRQNLPGAVANNFNFQQSTGGQDNLHNVKGAYKLLVFYDPSCNVCKEQMIDLKAVDNLVQRTKENKVTILTICAVGSEENWLEYAAELPSDWINGYNSEEEIIRSGLYDLKAFPTFYLIGENNRVLLKDASLERIVGYITSLA